MDGWDLLPAQETEARKLLLANVSLTELFKKYSRSVEPRGGGTWTHKCVCPNPEHKGGNERTASCNFSEETKQFYCFGCGIRGDGFDLIALMTKQPADRLVEEAIVREKLATDGLIGVQRVSLADFIRFSHKLSITMRDYLKAFRDKPCYDEEAAWVDQAFKRVDERFAKIDKTKIEAVKRVYDQVMVDLERRKSSREVCV